MKIENSKLRIQNERGRDDGVGGITLIAGPPGAGKTTWALEHMAYGDLFLDVDYLFAALSHERMYVKPDGLLHYVLAARDGVIDALESRPLADANVWIVATAPAADDRRMYRERLGAEVVVLNVPADVCIDRIENDGRDDIEMWTELVNRWWERYEPDENDVVLYDEGGMMMSDSDHQDFVDNMKKRFESLYKGKSNADYMEVLDDNMEVRSWGDARLEVRAAEDGEDEAPVMLGNAVVFDRVSEPIMGIFREVIEPGAFDGVDMSDVRALLNHDPNYVLGRTTAGTLQLEVDELGLRFRIAPPETQWAQDLLVSVRRGDIDQMSFGFTVAKHWWERDTDDGLPVRHVTRIDRLYDVSPVTYPAYPQTTVAVRSLAESLRAQRNPLPDSPASGGGDGEGHIDDADDDGGPRARLTQLRRRINIQRMRSFDHGSHD